MEAPDRGELARLIGSPELIEVLADSCWDNLYHALVVTNETPEGDSVVLRRSEGSWRMVDEPSRGEVCLMVGRDRMRAGSTIPVGLGETIYYEAVSENGWWAFVAAGQARGLRLPGPSGLDADDTLYVLPAPPRRGLPGERQ